MDPQPNTFNPYTRGIASFVCRLRYEAIPEEVRQRIKLLILDTLGCGLYGARLESSRILIDTLSRVDRTKDCSVWGTPSRFSAPNAALVNGTLVGGFEFDDTHSLGAMHVGAATLPALIALAESRPGISGRGFIAATVAGYEVGPRVGMCMGVEHRDQGWHPSATIGVFSATAAAAAGIQLTEEQTVHALGIAGTQASGLMAAQDGAMVKCMHSGKASQSGLYGALLAEAGFTGIAKVFESEYGGFCTTFSRSQDRFRLWELTADLGERFETMRVSLKFYPCAMSIHTTLDAIRKIQERTPFTAGDVRRIVVHCSPGTMEHVGWKYHPQEVASAQMNLSFCVATLLIAGDVFVDQFLGSAITDPARAAFAEKIEIQLDPQIADRGPASRYMVRIEVKLNNGATLEETVEAPRGGKEKFATEAQVVEKFEKLASHVFPPTQVAAIRDATLRLEKIEDVVSLTRMLGTAHAD